VVGAVVDDEEEARLAESSFLLKKVSVTLIEERNTIFIGASMSSG